MKNLMYSVYDKVAQEGGPIFTAKNEDVAIRKTVQLLINQPPNTIEDYKLLYVGIVNTETMVVTPIDPPKEIDFIDTYDLQTMKTTMPSMPLSKGVK